MVLGYDVMVRLGKALVPEKHYRRGFHQVGTNFVESIIKQTLIYIGRENPCEKVCREYEGEYYKIEIVS